MLNMQFEYLRMMVFLPIKKVSALISHSLITTVLGSGSETVRGNTAAIHCTDLTVETYSKQNRDTFSILTLIMVIHLLICVT